ncbi:MAG: hypothetical protein QF921_06340 [Pseudomonadales bacterium]|nr:hypothetical protein [Pseudomonadales bacterium]MDP6469456.1 hypothetical protein [Pseudomonadales bacterium]MDP6827298.1 hypothetical protein [Pseudomonadales bacterium]MDP6971121.1 hypothetical protein [Pseudomonadales bacterium]|tara:strand:+ start:3405 stop:3575 length:171 start_codon:yes stop_codon:yes gene_type:complete
MDDQSLKYDLDVEAEDFEDEEIKASDPKAFYASMRAALKHLKAFEAELDNSYIDVA